MLAVLLDLVVLVVFLVLLTLLISPSRRPKLLLLPPLLLSLVVVGLIITHGTKKPCAHPPCDPLTLTPNLLIQLLLLPP